MKTNQVLTRKMGSFDVLQRTSDGFFNATELIGQWNRYSGMQKQIIHYTGIEPTKEFINALISEENLKERSDVLLQKRGKRGGTWMHPLLFIDFAMWLNPTFKVKVLKFVYDQLIQYRNEAGDTYIEMCAAIKSISRPDEISQNIQKIAKAINVVVFGRHEREARNKMAEEIRMKELSGIQSKITELINLGYLTSFNHVREYLLRVWRSKYQPKEMAS